MKYVLLAQSGPKFVSEGSRKLCSTFPSKGNRFQYDEIVKNFRWKIPEYWNFAEDVIDVHASNPKQKDKLAFQFIPENEKEESLKWTYSQLSEISKMYATGFQTNLGKINRAMVILPKIPEWWILNISTLRTGTILLPGTSMLTENDIDSRLTKSESDCLIVDTHLASRVDKMADKHKKLKYKIFVPDKHSENEVNIDQLKKNGWISLQSIIDTVQERDLRNCLTAKTKSSDVMQIYFTSGTTGSPKMVGHTHGSYGHCHWVTGKYWLDLTQDDLHWNIADTGWAKSAWSSLFAPWTQGAGLFVHGMSRFVPEAVLKCLSDYPISTLCAPPTMYRAIVMQNKKLLAATKMSNLRHCVSAGEPLNEEVIKIWKDLTGIWIHEGYGQTETALIAGTFKGMDIRPGSMGKPAPGFDVHIIDDDGQKVKTGVHGNIAIKCETKFEEGKSRHSGLFLGYIGDAEKTSKTFLDDYYLTGDRGHIDEDDYIWFDARSDDVIISAGYRIGPFEVESVLLEHEAVVESAVVASPDVARGHVVKAFIVLKNNFQELISNDKEEEAKLILQIQDFVKMKTAPYKYPRKISFVETLPKTISGKIRRAVMRDEESKQSQG